MATKIRAQASTVEGLDKEMMSISKSNPQAIVTCYARFGKADIYIYKSQPRRETPDTYQMYDEFGGFLKNGKIVKPSATWMKDFNRRPVLN